MRETCLIQDVYHVGDSSSGRESSDAFSQIAAPDLTASAYARRDEQVQLQRDSLVHGLRKLVNGMKDSLNFRDIKIVELIFYCNLSNKDVAQITDVKDKNIAVIKHRYLKQVQELVGNAGSGDGDSTTIYEDILTEIWESQRLSCPKRSTVGAYHLETLDSDWNDYVEFHLNKLGCHYCRANLEDLKRQSAAEEEAPLRQRIMESTVGFLHKPS